MLSLRQHLPKWAVFALLVMLPIGSPSPMSLRDHIQTYLSNQSQPQYSDSTLARYLTQLLIDEGYHNMTPCSANCSRTDSELAMLYERTTNFHSRCLTLAKMSDPESEGVYVGIGSTHCVRPQHNMRCLNSRGSQCEWQYSMRDLGSEYFPRFLLEVQCGGCPADITKWTGTLQEWDDCLRQHDQCRYTPEEVVVEVLKRRGQCGDNSNEIWEVVRITDRINVGCSCTRG